MLDLLAMADYGSSRDDISGLWGPHHEGLLTPAMPEPRADEQGPVLPAPTNGNGSANGHVAGARLAMVEQETHDDVARLAQAIADSHADVVRPADLQATRAEMEGAFSQQLAVALYQLIAATNDRFATAEEHISQRVNDSVEVHTSWLAASLEANHRAASEMSEAIRSQIDSLRQSFVGPIGGLTEFQREVRHEVGRLGDQIMAQARETAHQSTVDRELRERHDDWVVKTAGDLGEVSAVLAAMKDELGSLREQVAELRTAVDDQGQNGRKSRRWGRSS
jgi:hypothetical protein